MRAERAWVAFSFIFVLCVVAVAAMFIGAGRDPYQVVPFSIAALAVYLYIVYKRYHIELVTKADIDLFSEPEDLRILSNIYGLKGTGIESVDRNRLIAFSKANEGKTFVWVAPGFVQDVSTALEIEESEMRTEESANELMRRLLSDLPTASRLPVNLVRGEPRNPRKLSDIYWCPVCKFRLKKTVAVCPECGADLLFYSTLAKSHLGRRLISAKEERKKSKFRYAA
jgi:predicted RNA-binding Zn-ribbon protein involved in translation (DUF1610 family)